MGEGILRYGGASLNSDNRASENFVQPGISNLSMSCTPIELLSNDGTQNVLATASGFFWRYRDKPYLVTNWHVVSGRNPFTGKTLFSTGFIPSAIAFYGCSIRVESGLVYVERKKYSLSFNEGMMERLSQPPLAKTVSVDLWAAPISSEIIFGKDATRTGFRGAENASCFLNDGLGKRIVTSAGDECFILGYPLHNYTGLMPPVWKRGSVASETNIGIDDKPMFLVDSATMPSMSGSPILRRATLFAADNMDVGALQEFVSFDFIGVYAGRLQSKDFERTNLGYAWYKILIDDVIDFYGYSNVS